MTCRWCSRPATDQMVIGCHPHTGEAESAPACGQCWMTTEAKS